MPERKLVIEVDINDGAVNSIGDLEREILAQNICGQAARKYLCTIVSFSEASFLIDILQGVKVSSSKLKKIFYENKTLPIRNPIYSQYNGQTIDAIIIDDTKSKRRSGGRPSIKGALGLDLETGEEFVVVTVSGSNYYGQ